MKRFLSVLLLCMLCGTFAGATPNTYLRPVKATHQRAKRHHAHKAGKHSRPRHQHHMV